MQKQKPKYKVPKEIKNRVRNFMNDFLIEQGQTKAGLAKLMQEKLNRSGCRPSLVKKFSNATFQLAEVMEILDLYDCELKIIKKAQIEDTEKTC